jgi:predicted CopG family antitoxin
MTKKLTITVSDEVYEGLHRRIGRRKISRFIDDLARDKVVDRNAPDYWLTASDEEIRRGYAEMAADEEAEREAHEWIESNIGETLDDEDFSDWPGYPSR